jgi:two-component system nitrogen regulation sensor histidine kinase NtrY
VTFRTKLLLISSFSVAGAVALVTGAVLFSARRSFERIDAQRREALLEQLRRELDSRGAEIGRAVERAAASATVQQLLAGTADYDRAQAEAESQALDFLDVVQPDLTIVSSAHSPARFGYKNDWQVAPEDWSASDAFLARIPLQEGTAVALVAVRSAGGGGKAYVAGGRRVTPEFLKSLGQAPGMHALLWVPPGEVIDAQGATVDINKLRQLVDDAKHTGREAMGAVQWTAARSSAEAFLALPLMRRAQPAGVLLAGTSLAEQLALEREILWIGITVAVVGILLGALLGWWTTERITRPVEQLVKGARSVAAGDWSAHVDVSSKDEIGELARAFNKMTSQLVEQRDRAIQAERVAAWRELARRLAHELKNPLFPLQITVENVQRARKLPPNEFDEVFAESTSTLLTEVSNLKAIIGRFSDFAKMPAPRFEKVDLNEIIRGVMRLYDAQLHADGKPRIEPVLDLGEGDLHMEADEEQLRRALSNLVLNAIDAMPAGGTLRISSARQDSRVRVSVSDSGQGLTEEECARLFTPYYTTKHHGTGLGLAIVQSVVSDHRGKISVTSAPAQGATFLIDLPVAQGDLV